MNDKIMATKLREKSDHMLKLAKKHPDVTIYYNDAGDLRSIAQLIEEKDYAGALEFAYRKDTALREEIPEDVWKFLLSKNGEENGQ